MSNQTVLLAQIKDLEEQLSQALYENNSLESSVLSQLYQIEKVQLPQNIHAALTEVEQRHLSVGKFITPEKIAEINEAAEEIEKMNQEQEEGVNAQRQELLNLLRQYNEPTPEPDQHLLNSAISAEIEIKARELAREAEGIDDNELIQVLARGTEEQNPNFLEQAQELAQLSLQNKTNQIISDSLEDAVDILSNLQSLAQPIDSTEFISAISEATTKMNSIALNQPIEDIDQGGWDIVSRAAEEVAQLRKKLEAILSDSSSVALPKEVCDVQSEIQTLQQCKASIEESIQVMQAYIDKLVEEGVTNHSYMNREEANKIIQQYNDFIHQ